MLENFVQAAPVRLYVYWYLAASIGTLAVSIYSGTEV